MISSCTSTLVKGGDNSPSRSRVVSTASTANLPPVVSTTSNSLGVVHRYVFIMYSHPDKRRSTTLLEQSCRPSSTRTSAPRCLHNEQLVGGRTSVCFHRVFASRSKEGDTCPRTVVSVASTPELPPAVSTTSDWWSYIGMFSSCIRTQVQEGGQLHLENLCRPSARRTCPPLSPQRATHFNCDDTSKGFQRVFARWQKPGGGHSNPGQLRQPFHDGPAPDCLHNGRLFLFFFFALAARATGRCLPGQTYNLNTIVYINMFSSCIACPPVVYPAVGNSFSA